MKTQLFSLLLLAGCAGPTAHRTARDDSSLALSQPEAVRAPVASTLTSEDPLEAPSCGLGSEPCAPPDAEAKPMEHHHHPPAEAPASATPGPKPMEHHHPPAAVPASATPEPKPMEHHHPPAPASEPAPMPPHHQGAMAPKAPAPAVEAMPASVVDPVCKMKIDPTKAKGGSLKVDGQTFFFCSSSCRNTFLSQHPGAK